MREVAPEPDLDQLLSKYHEDGGVLDYVLLEPVAEAPPEQLHRAAAMAGIAAIDRRMERWAVSHASEEHPVDMFFRVRWDEAKLNGQSVPFSTFWGTDDIEPKSIGDRAWSLQEVAATSTWRMAIISIRRGVRYATDWGARIVRLPRSGTGAGGAERADTMSRRENHDDRRQPQGASGVRRTPSL